MCVSIKQALERVVPKIYYQAALNGSLGKHTGQGWYKTQALCPFHNDKRPGTFHVNIHSGKFKCFSCGAYGGDVLDFHKMRHGLDTKTALKQLWGAA